MSQAMITSGRSLMKPLNNVRPREKLHITSEVILASADNALHTRYAAAFHVESQQAVVEDDLIAAAVAAWLTKLSVELCRTHRQSLA